MRGVGVGAGIVGVVEQGLREGAGSIFGAAEAGEAARPQAQAINVFGVVGKSHFGGAQGGGPLALREAQNA